MGLSLCIGATAVHADPEDTFNLVVAESLQRDSNLFRRSAGQESAEQIQATTLGLRINKPYSLQRFTLDASLIDNRYRQNNYLNYVGKNLNAAWLWSVTPRLTGNISASYVESLNSFLDYTGVARNIRTIETYRATADWDAWGRVHLLAGASQTDVKNDQLLQQEGDYKATAAEYGLKYLMPSGSYVSFVSRATDGEYAQRVVNPVNLIDSGFAQSDHELNFNWPITGKSRLSGRWANIHREHTNYDQRDFKGGVGSLDFTWDVSGKVRLIAGVQRDLVSYQSADASYYVRQSFSLTPIWQVSGKTTLRARLNRESRDYQGAINGNASRGEEIYRQSLLAVDWMPLRTLTLSLSHQREVREAAAASADFVANITGLSGNLSF